MKSLLPHALRELGPAALLRFGQYRLQLNSGWIRRRTPLSRWDERPLSSWLRSRHDADPGTYAAYRISAAPRLFLPGMEILRSGLHDLLGERADSAITVAEQIREGTFPLFGFHRIELDFPPDWHAFAPLTGESAPWRAPSDCHWTDIDLLELRSDVKLLWEVNRFGWVFPLARAYVLTEDARHFETFWTLFDSWRTENPPNQGLNWHSAQEVSIRLLAMIFGWYVFQEELQKDPRRMAFMAQTIAVHADRIPPTLSYAIAQGNNHLLVEAVGLYSVGLLFPEFRQSGRWRSIGRRWLIRALRKQVLADGGYVQHSVNYHRLALQTALWAARIAGLQGEPLPGSSLDQIDSMVTWLEALVDPATGAAPNFGPNDGAEILPLSMTPFDDHRPALQAAARLLRDETIYGRGTWDEWSLWLGVLPREQDTQQPSDSQRLRALPPSGLYVLAGEASRGVLRASRFETRPGHADQLHLDLWFGHFNAAVDAGTYLYSAEAPWGNAFTGAKHHNTVLLDGSDAMIRAGRFLWLNWNQAALLGHWRSADGDLELLAAERFADLAGEVTHRRVVIRAGDQIWLVVDDLLGGGEHQVDLSWSVPDLPWTIGNGALALSSPVGAVRLRVEGEGLQQRLLRAGACVCGDETGESTETCGWVSPTYALKIPALQLVSRSKTDLPQRLKSHWLWLDADEHDLQIGWNDISARKLPVEWVRYKGQILETDDAHTADPSGIRRTG